jgi:hypothetical protein
VPATEPVEVDDARRGGRRCAQRQRQRACRRGG